MTNKEAEKRLWDEISVKRQEMTEAYDTEGNTEKVLALSRELDQLLNQYDKLRMEMQSETE